MRKTNSIEIKYKLYRTVKEILHPTISKRNISNYKIILDEDLLPVQVFYPKKVSNLDRVIIFIHGSEEVTECTYYSDICKDFALKTKCLFISIDYEEEKHNYNKMIKIISNTIKHIISELLEIGIDSEKIILMGDSTAGSIITAVNVLMKDEITIEKEILFYPTLSLEYFGKTKYHSIKQNQELNFNLIPNLKKYFSSIATKEELSSELMKPLNRDDKIPKTLLFIGSVDCLKDEVFEYNEKYNGRCTYVELPFLSHGFLKRLDKDEEKIIKEAILKFIEE